MVRTKTTSEGKYIQSPDSKKWVKVSSLVPVGRRGSARWSSYCSRSEAIRGSWKTNKESKNWLQRRRWKCDYVSGEVRQSE